MEDPWGSPWATSDAPPPKIDLPAAPPSAHFSADSSTVNLGRRRSSQSPWGDDATGDDDEAWGGWNDAASSGSLGRRTRSRSPASWGHLSPGMRPAVVSRGASPDPWRLSDGRKSLSRQSSMQDLKRKSDSTLGLGFEVPPETDKLSPGDALFAMQSVWDGPYPDRQQEPKLRPSSAMDDEGPVSRPESPTDSPRPVETALDQPQPSRKSSAKVQELVDMYDGMSRRSPSTSSGISPPPTRKTSLVVKSPPSPLPNVPVINHVAPASPAESVDNGFGLQFNDENVTEAHGGVTESDNILADNTLRESGKELDSSQKLGAETEQEREPEPEPEPWIPLEMEFPVDWARMDELFPSSPVAEPEPEPVPDVIIDDTFTEISERKAWYRLSRPGSLRMHNMGDGEGYVRMDWKRSTARTETLKIVRRWMEEESISGRPIMGRKIGAIGGSVFNWNSSAPPVEIGELLRKKAHSKQASTASKASIASPTTTDFGWGSPPVSPALSIRPPPSKGAVKEEAEGEGDRQAENEEKEESKAFKEEGEKREEGEEKPRDKVPSSRPKSLIMAPSPPSRSVVHSRDLSEPPRVRPRSIVVLPLKKDDLPSIDQALASSAAPPVASSGPQEVSVIADKVDEDDDDWGEMVSSPTDPSLQLNGGITQPSLSLEPAVPAEAAPALPSEARAPNEIDYSTSKHGPVDESTPPLSFADPSRPPISSEARPSSSGGLSTQPKRDAVPNSKARHQASLSLDSSLFQTQKGPFSKPLHLRQTPLSPLTAPPMTVPAMPPVEEEEQAEPTTILDDEEISRILGGLPDLSYMLRR